MELKKPVPLRVSLLQKEGRLTPYYFPPLRGHSTLLQFPTFILQNLGRNPSCFRPFSAPPLQSQIQRPRPNLPSPAPDGVDVRVELLHSRSQELEEPLGEKVAACRPGHRGSRPGHSSRTSPRHLELPLRRDPPRGPPGTEALLKRPRGGARETPTPTQPPGFLGNGVWSPQSGEKDQALMLSVVVVLHKP